jgi:hypothetical protein
MVILIVGGVAAIAIVIGPRLGQRIMMFAAAAGLAASLAGPLAYTIQTIATPHTGSMPSAGPTTSGDGFPGSGKGFPGNFEGGQMPPGMNSTAPTPTTDNTGSAPSTATSGNSGNTNSNSTMAANFKQGGSGGTEKGDTASKQIVSMLQKDASKYTWVAATVGSQTSATYQLASDEPVMDIGGFTGSDPTPTFAQFKKYISEGKIHYYISGGGMNHGGGFKQMDGNTSNNTTATGSTNGETNGSNMQQGPMGGSSNSDITNWVQNTFKSTTVDGVTIYDLTQIK